MAPNGLNMADNMVMITSPTPLITALMLSHSPPNQSPTAPQSSTNIAANPIKATTAAIIRPMGLAIMAAFNPHCAAVMIP